MATPKPIAYVEIFLYSIPYKHFFISEFLYNTCNIEVFIKKNIYKEKGIFLSNFFNTFSKMVLSLWEKGIYHKDLSGKNLLTIDGQEIYLVDLDSAVIKKHFDIQYKIRNLVQIYDSFCDFLEEDILKNFVSFVLPELANNDLNSVYHKIQLLQKERRKQHINNLKNE
ncbi:MAG TPA: lipopolysaccharide kinase InaA family protein [Candidatus Hydrogenedens sp.]|nr:lipopolysaccharide kinase InaA family protein [Candidatus Hydrogenedens sp.]